MQKIIVTGGAGFIGSHLIEYLLEEKENKIFVIDDFSEGKLRNLPQNKRLTVCRMSILNNNLGERKFFEDVDVVFHLAALTRPRWSIEYPIETNQVNVEGTLRVLKICVDKGVNKLVYVSSASVYGKQNKLVLSEDMKLHPVSPYALTKQIGEKYCKLYGELYGLKYDIVRPFNVYGSRQSLHGAYSAAVTNFINQLERGETPYITGDGRQSRDFVYVKDVVRLMALVGRRSGTDKVFNAGSGKSVSINNLYEMISKLLKKKKKPGYIDPVIDPETKADIIKAKRLLNWKPEYNLEDGLKETIEEMTG